MTQNKQVELRERLREATLMMDEELDNVEQVVLEVIQEVQEQGYRQGEQDKTFKLVALYNSVLKDLYGKEISDLVQSRVNTAYKSLTNNTKKGK
jgi:hypothetical protein